MSNSIPKVLIVDDDWRLQEMWKEVLLAKGISVFSALSIEQAEELFSANPDFDAIVMDACVPGDEPTTVPLVRKLRETYTGPIIANSSNKEFGELLVTAGCSHQAEKMYLVKTLLQILGIPGI